MRPQMIYLGLLDLTGSGSCVTSERRTGNSAVYFRHILSGINFVITHTKFGLLT